MPSQKQLLVKQEDLEEEYEELRKKLKKLKKDYIIEADSELKYKLERRIEEYDKQLEKIEEELDKVEEELKNLDRQKGNPNDVAPQNVDSLHRLLLKLGYWEQQRLFEEVAITKKVSHGAFLIHGLSKEYGQRWLLNRLALVIPESLEGKNIVIDLNRTASRSDISAIWGEFAGRVGLPEDIPTSKIVEMIHKLWQSQNVLIAFNNVDESIKENLQDLLNDFWKSLMWRITDSKNSENKFQLLMFCLDYQGLVIKWNVGFVNNYNSDWRPNIPLAFPDITPFSDESLRSWIEQQSDHLPKHIFNDKERVVKTLMEKNGTPEPTLRKICELCGCNWFEQERKWLRL